jgi:hypothetical protein
LFSLEEFIEEANEVFNAVNFTVVFTFAREIESSSSALVGDSFNFVSSVDNHVVNTVGFATVSGDNSLNNFTILDVWDGIINFDTFGLINWVGIGPVRVSL